MAKIIDCICKTCGKQFGKLDHQVAKTDNHFCSRSCAATYNNTQRKRKTWHQRSTVICPACNKTFERNDKQMRASKTGYCFCSKSCAAKWRLQVGYNTLPKREQYPRLDTFCSQCHLSISITQSTFAASKTKRFFCSQSCAGKYNSEHKTTGTRRSKLESYLESQLRAEFPNLVLVCNGKDAIGSELDFYFPQLRLAIELNGIFHYEPIYGSDKLERIQANDQQKSISCHAAGIEFCTIDASAVKRTTSAVKDRYWLIVKNIIQSVIGRESNVS